MRWCVGCRSAAMRCNKVQGSSLTKHRLLSCGMPRAVAGMGPDAVTLLKRPSKLSAWHPCEV